MNKFLVMACALVANAMVVNAETAVSESNEISEPALKVKEMNISTASTDAGMLESKNALMPAPKETDDKDVAFWAQSVLSRVKVLAYAQAGYTATFQENGPNANTFDMKRAVLMIAADIAPKFNAFFMHEFKSGKIQEYYMEYHPCKALNFRFGQTKIEMSMTNPFSPRVYESINCAPQAVSWLCGADPLMNNGSGRDLGLMMYGDLFNNHIRYVVQVVNGGQINTADQNNQKNIIAKLEYKPVKNFRFVVSGQKGYGCAVATSDYNGYQLVDNGTGVMVKDHFIKKGDTYRQDRYAVGFEWLSSVKGNDYFKNRCTTVHCEALGGRDGDCHSFGVYGATTIPVYKGMDVVAQADYFNRNTDMNYKQTNLTAGVQYWMHTKCRIQAQYTYSILSDEMKAVSGKPGNYGQFMTQVQFSF